MTVFNPERDYNNGNLQYISFMIPNIEPTDEEKMIEQTTIASFPEELIKFFNENQEYFRNEIRDCIEDILEPEHSGEQPLCDKVVKMMEYNKSYKLVFENPLLKLVNLHINDIIQIAISKSTPKNPVNIKEGIYHIESYIRNILYNDIEKIN
jgi:hypothetical protein